MCKTAIAKRSLDVILVSYSKTGTMQTSHANSIFIHLERLLLWCPCFFSGACLIHIVHKKLMKWYRIVMMERRKGQWGTLESIAIIIFYAVFKIRTTTMYIFLITFSPSVFLCRPKSFGSVWPEHLFLFVFCPYLQTGNEASCGFFSCHSSIKALFVEGMTNSCQQILPPVL